MWLDFLCKWKKGSVMRAVATLVLVAILASMSGSAWSVVGGKAKYLGGTIPGLKEKTEAAVDLKNEDKFIFSPKASVGPTLEIPWAGVEDIEYGQKAGRRIVSAVFLTPFALFAKKRRVGSIGQGNAAWSVSAGVR